jgi:hypothetical protein
MAMAGSAAMGTIDVARGGGEFGRGFYTQTSLSNAFRRGYALYGSNAAVLIVSIDGTRYHRLRFRRLTLKQARRLNASLHGNARKTYATQHDVIVGPLVFQPNIDQQKFQTVNAQNLLNGPHSQRSVYP